MKGKIFHINEEVIEGYFKNVENCHFPEGIEKLEQLLHSLPGQMVCPSKELRMLKYKI